MNINDVSTQLLYTTVPIYAKKDDGSLASGTGFIFSIRETETTSIPLLITNYHVLEKSTVGFVELHIAENGLPTNRSVRVQFDKSIIDGNKLGNLDLIAVPLASTFNELKNKSVEVFFRSVDQNMITDYEKRGDFAAIEDITFIGYPSGLYDEKNKIPIIRQGITATPIWNDFKGEEEFLIDAGVFPGSSGSPVFIYNRGTYPTNDGIVVGSRLLFVGIISQTILIDKSTGKEYLNLGKVISSQAMYRELDRFVHKLKKDA
jgi:hypothetical protein